MTTVDNFRIAYALYEDFSEYSYNCISYLMDNSELIWKLLKYNDRDAWNKPDLTKEEKAALIYSGQPTTTDFRVFMDTGNPDVWKEEISQARIYPIKILPKNRTTGIVLMAFDFFTHYKLNQLSNYKSRVDMATQEYIRVFNGINIAGIGRLAFNGTETVEDKAITLGQLPFKGKSVYMSNRDI